MLYYGIEKTNQSCNYSPSKHSFYFALWVCQEVEKFQEVVPHHGIMYTVSASLEEL